MDEIDELVEAIQAQLSRCTPRVNATRARLRDSFGSVGPELLPPRPLWDALASHGIVDSFGGAECERVLPAALAFIYEAANRGPSFEVPDWAAS